MQISSLFRITSHNQVVDVDDVSTSPNKVSNQVLIFENVLPEPGLVKKFIAGTSVGTIIVVDAFEKQPFNTFDRISDGTGLLRVIKTLTSDPINAVLCLPDDYLTFFVNQNLEHSSKTFSVKVVTLSDRAHRGIYEDKSGPKAVEMLGEYFDKINKKAVIQKVIIPDNIDELSLILEESKVEKTDILITTGGTGIGKRDITVEAVRSRLDKEIPGIMEMIRLKYGAENPKALLSRSIAGTMGQTIIFTLPGSLRAVEEYLTEIFKTLDHILYMIHSIDIH